MTQNFLSRQPPIAGANQHIQQMVAGFVKGHFTPQNGRAIIADVLGHIRELKIESSKTS